MKLNRLNILVKNLSFSKQITKRKVQMLYEYDNEKAYLLDIVATSKRNSYLSYKSNGFKSMRSANKSKQRSLDVKCYLSKVRRQDDIYFLRKAKERFLWNKIVVI